MLQAENEEEYAEWILALRSQTEEALLGLGFGTDGGGGLGLSPPTSPLYSLGPLRTGAEKGGGTHAAFVERVRRANPTCADCGAPGPEWAVTTAGVMVCIQCSGIHRSLGVHISRVRSLLLDRWPRALRLVMESVGNAQFNDVWEAALSYPSEGKGGKPLGLAASREEREAFIRDKYLGRAFVAQGERAGEEEDPDVILYEAARKGDVMGLLWSLAHGGVVNYVSPGQRGRTPVHAVCEGAKGGGGGGTQGRLVCLELLHQNGACLDALDADEASPLDLAMMHAGAPLNGGEEEWRQLNQLSVGSCGNMSLVSYLLAKLEKRTP